ncbi:GSCOCG00012876001-RA-CDS [Cotesia congregata]|nr:GSCOCG00012876001-RA-CDS [Cotesia congregata]
MKRTDALAHLEKLVSGLQDFLQTKQNVHKEIKSKSTNICSALRRFKKLDQEWQEIQQQHGNIVIRTSVTAISPAKADTLVEEMDTGGEGDVESVVEDGEETGAVIRPGKRKERNSPDSMTSRTKKKDIKPSPPKNTVIQNGGKKEANEWQKVQSRKSKREQAEEKLQKQPPKEPRPEPKRKKPRKWIRPDALIIRPAETAKYAEILKRIKQDVPDEQVRTTVDKIQRTRTGSLLITLSRKSTDRGQALQKTIAGILQEDAKVICKGPQEDVEIRDLDGTTTKEDIQAALKTEIGETCEIPLGTIKIHKAYRGTQTAVMTLPAAAARKILTGSGKVRIGWANCRIRATRRPIQCFKCWHFGHLGSQCKSNVDRSKLCIRCGQEGHKIAKCENPAKCVLCADQSAHHAGASRCPVFQEALQKITNKQT